MKIQNTTETSPFILIDLDNHPTISTFEIWVGPLGLIIGTHPHGGGRPTEYTVEGIDGTLVLRKLMISEDTSDFLEEISDHMRYLTH